MIITLILRLDAAAISEGDLRGWAEIVGPAETGVTPTRLPIDGPHSVVRAAASALAARDASPEVPAAELDRERA